MVAVTYGTARAVAGALKGKTAAKKGQQGFFARFMASIMDARLRQAERELALHGFARSQEDGEFHRGW